MSSDQPQHRSSRSWLKALFYLVLSVAFCLVLLVCLLPTIVSSSWGKQRIEASINAQIPGSIQIGGLSLGWFGPQDIHNVVLKSPDGKRILSLAKATTSASIYSLWNHSRPNSLEIEDLNAFMEVDSSGTSNFERALYKDCCAAVSASNPVMIELKNTHAKIDLSGSTDNLTAVLSGKTSRNSLQGAFAIDAQLNGIASTKLFKNGHFLSNLLELPPGTTFKLNADITNFPVILVDQLLSFERPEAAGILPLLLGEEVNGTIHQVATDQGLAFNLNAASPNLNMNFQIDANDRLSLTKPAVCELLVTPELVDKLTKMMKATNAWKLTAPTKARLTLDRFSSPLGKPLAELDLQDVELIATLHVNDATVSSNQTPGLLELRNFQASAEMTAGSKTAHVVVNGDAFHDKNPLRIQIDASVEKPSRFKDLAEYLKNQLTANILVEGNLSQAIDSLFLTNNLLTKSIGDTTSASANIKIIGSKPVFTTSLNASIIQFSDLQLHLNGNKVEGEKAVFNFNLPQRAASQLPLSGSLAVRSFSWNTAALPNKLQGDFNVDELILNDASRQIRHAIDGTFSADFPLTDNNNNSPKGSITVNLHNDLISGKAEFDVSDAISLKQGSKAGNFLLQLTPDNFPLLRNLFNVGNGQAGLSLVEPTKVNFDLKQLYIPIQNNVPSLQQAAIAGKLIIPRLNLASSTARQSVILSDIETNIESSNISDQLVFTAKATGGRGYTDENGQQAGISLNGTLAQILTSEGSFHPNMSIALTGNAEGVPIPLLCELLCSDPKRSKQIQALLGSRVNAQAKIQLQQMNGPVYLAVNGTNSNFILDGYIANGHLNLNRNFEAEIAVTPELGRYVLNDFIPIFDEVLSSENPIKLTIGQQGFNLPIYNPTLAQITINQASLELGKIYFANSGLLAKSLRLLAANNANFLSIWLTPAYFMLSQGTLTLQRVDMLISERYPAAAWGTVDFLRDRVNMMLGLSGAAINKAFGVSGVQNKYMLQLPLRGTLRDATIDKSKIAAKLSAIVAQSHGGPQGLVLGTILDVASGGLTEPAPPSPTTNPLPWANQYDPPEETESNTTQDDSEKPAKIKNPIKQIGKEASNLLKEIFR